MTGAATPRLRTPDIVVAGPARTPAFPAALTGGTGPGGGPLPTMIIGTLPVAIAIASNRRGSSTAVVATAWKM